MLCDRPHRRSRNGCRSASASDRTPRYSAATQRNAVRPADYACTTRRRQAHAPQDAIRRRSHCVATDGSGAHRMQTDSPRSQLGRQSPAGSDALPMKYMPAMHAKMRMYSVDDTSAHAHARTRTLLYSQHSDTQASLTLVARRRSGRRCTRRRLALVAAATCGAHYSRDGQESDHARPVPSTLATTAAAGTGSTPAGAHAVWCNMLNHLTHAFKKPVAVLWGNPAQKE